ncbi:MULTISPECIES: cell wall hydrolase [Paracoccus]|uniref:Cell wall hydrolase n=1 Tax=Paracoccus kondratievae TaxID=135740 RepID=A0AAD3P1D6_9RHOB|nr:MULTISPECIES: cell wall hydrolase [Paracoccus]GLK65073.1 cell wall hydrolase [Paracoccus kondratievae]SMG34381.1 Cell Wall Hydrolase [Paracoccus sp. J56]
MKFPRRTLRLGIAVASALLVLSGCSGFRRHSELECMERAMYFESNRSSRDGMIAVGSVVMNRVRSDKFPNSVCGVVGQKGQFARGIMTRKMNPREMPKIKEAARSVMRGERHPLIGDATFFHTAGHRFSYDNMHYVLVTGGNAFYEKRKSAFVTRPVPPPPIEGITGR